MAEAKKREEEANAAKAYAEFLDDFQGEGAGKAGKSNFVNAESKSVYAPSLKSAPQGHREPHHSHRKVTVSSTHSYPGMSSLSMFLVTLSPTCKCSQA